MYEHNFFYISKEMLSGNNQIKEVISFQKIIIIIEKEKQRRHYIDLLLKSRL